MNRPVRPQDGRAFRSPDWLGAEFAELRTVNAGPRARVVLARDKSGTLVVIRYVPASELLDRRRTARFRDELDALRRLNHPRLPRLVRYAMDPRISRPRRDVGNSFGAAVVTEAVEGASLRHVLERQRQLSPRAALLVFAQSLSALAAVHDLGLVVETFRPGVVLVGREGIALTDVGTAAVAAPVEPELRAPELWQGRPATAATDVYAATCVFVQCLAGQVAHRGSTPFTLMSRHTAAPVPIGMVAEPLRPLLAAGLAKDPGRRRTAAELAADVRGIAAATYGQDWEAAGLAELAAAAEPLIEPLPQASEPVSSRPPEALPTDPTATVGRATDPRPAAGPYAPGPPPADTVAGAARPLLQTDPTAPDPGAPHPATQSPPIQRRPPRPQRRRRRHPVLRTVVLLGVVGAAIVLGRDLDPSAIEAQPGSGLIPTPAHRTSTPARRTPTPRATRAATQTRPPQARTGRFPTQGLPPSRAGTSRSPARPTPTQSNRTVASAGCGTPAGLTLSPSGGDPDTMITVMGAGVVRGGRVEVYFHADLMGTAPTTTNGCFRLTVPIPNSDLYSDLPQAYTVYVHEYDDDGYVGNGPGRATFQLTSS